MAKHSNPKLQKYTDVFQNIMLDCLQRRVFFRCFEAVVKGKGIGRDNSFLLFYSMDYFRSQLADLRKFFDKDPRVYEFSYITKHCGLLKRRHKELFGYWEEIFQDQANKAAFHIERDYITHGVDVQVLDDFIDKLNDYLNLVIEELNRAGYKVKHIERGKESVFLSSIVPEEFDEVIKMIKTDKK